MAGLAVVLLGVVAAAGLSLNAALREPNSPGWRLRAAEWARDHALGSVADLGEWAWYTTHVPRRGGAPESGLSSFPAPYASEVPESEEAPSAPAGVAPIAPVLGDPFEHEGEWRAAGRLAFGRPALLVTSFRPDPSHTGVLVAVARFDPALVRFNLVPGTHDPEPRLPGAGEIAADVRPGLLAAFNGGFRLKECLGGAIFDGQAVRSLVSGVASLVLFEDGRVTVGDWGRDVTSMDGVRSVRQNLHLIVDHGAPDPALARNPDGAWGTRLNQGLYTWRSALGVDATGAVLYLAGDGLTLASLGQAMAHAGAARAMARTPAPRAPWRSTSTARGSPSTSSSQTRRPTSACAGRRS